ncbi:hypothetical protein AB0J86_11395 [Micromonospora sp. NPDC049559]|uniref:hypothetical protein n=1 Tax=Micromonospora sp. NPDC049559 TaxID=3155923 RepID=UPI003443893A
MSFRLCVRRRAFGLSTTFVVTAVALALPGAPPAAASTGRARPVEAGPARPAETDRAWPAETDRAWPAETERARPGQTSDSGQVTFEVLPAVPTATPTGSPGPTPEPSGGALPKTDSNGGPGWLAALGGLLVVVGALLIVALVLANRRLAGRAGGDG